MLAPGIAVTLWHAGGLRHAYNDGGAILLEGCRPSVVQLHASVTGVKRDFAAIASRVRALLPGARVWCGLGVDGWLDGRRTPQQTADKILSAAEAAADGGTERVIWNAESAYETYRSAGVAVGRIVTQGFALTDPRVSQGFTSLDHPTYHVAPWTAWCYPGTPVVDAFAQVYAAPGGEHVVAHRGALQRREATSLASFATAVQRGLIEADLTPDTPDDLDWRPYVQLHSVPTTDTVALALRHDLCAFWAGPTRLDLHGRRALYGACELARRGWRGPDAVRVAQTRLGVTVDGVYGPETARALGAAWDFSAG